MKKNSFLWAALSMTAALVMTACTSEDNTVETPAAPQAEVKTIPYSVTVSGGATTRATVDETDMKTLYFAAGDKLYISGDYISGALDIQTGMGTASATFSGTLNYTGEGTPPDDTLLRGWLIGSEDKLFMITNGEVKGYSYPTTYCADVATAVKEYSHLWNTADVTYASRTFPLEQQTAFLNFVITFEDGTAAGTTLTTVVSNNGSVIATADVTTKTDTNGKVVAEFVLPFDTGFHLRGATVKMGDKEAISFGGADQKLLGKVYNVKKTYAAAPLTLTGPAVGQVIGSDGKNYAANATLPTGVTKVAIIAYVDGENHGLALALADEGSMNWATAVTTAAAHTPAFTGGTWKLPSQDEWKQMFKANDVSETSYAGLNTTINNAGGTILQDGGGCWSSSEDSPGVSAYGVHFNLGYASWTSVNEELDGPVRACLAFGYARGHALASSAVGEIVGSDGLAYYASDKNDLPLGVTAVAMVAYKSATAGESLAIQLNDSPESKNWNDAKTYASGLTAVPGGTWRLPSKADWQNMFVGCAKSGDAGASDSMNPIAGFKEKIGATGITWQSYDYWSSTDSGSNAWFVRVDLNGSSALAGFYEYLTSHPYNVLGCLAF